MGNESWKTENGKRKMEVGKWKLENGKRKMEVGSWKKFDNRMDALIFLSDIRHPLLLMPFTILSFLLLFPYISSHTDFTY